MGRVYRSSGSAGIPSLVFLIVITLGASAGLGALTFTHARGLSYFSNDPAACINCHTMYGNYESWMKSGHQHTAKCNDCHVPVDFIGKWTTKALNGYHHSMAFTFKDVPHRVIARPASKRVVQNNCIRCHSAMASHPAGTGGDAGGELQCISCHKGAGHGK